MSPSILQDHAQHPRHRREVLDMPMMGHAANPMCADVVDVGIVVDDGVIVDAAFVGKGCALCIGGASLLCEYLLQRSVLDLDLSTLPHLGDERIGRMREGCVRVSVTSLERALLFAFL